MRRLFLLILSSAVWCSTWANDMHLSVTLKGTFTTNTGFFYDINRTNFVFDEEKVISSNLGYGADVRWNLMWDRFYLGIGVEKIRSVDHSFAYSSFSDNVRIPTDEGFSVLMIELSGYYIVPISSDDIQFYMGGGFGLYDGNRLYSIAGVQASTVNSESSMGIHVLTGVEYKISNYIGVRGEIKFRDPHFDVTDKFDQPYTTFQGVRVPLRQTESVTRINLYGINYMVGMVFQF
ncbi:MAG: outer membrane beta-barrel protein [Bacteroidota bacterium]|nr:outer membrane beta-barrel protein [Bacteroidota bacterium]